MVMHILEKTRGRPLWFVNHANDQRNASDDKLTKQGFLIEFYFYEITFNNERNPTSSETSFSTQYLVGEGISS